MRIDDLKIDQLLEFNKLICRRTEELQARQELSVLSSLNLGQALSFEPAQVRS